MSFSLSFSKIGRHLRVLLNFKAMWKCLPPVQEGFTCLVAKSIFHLKFPIKLYGNNNFNFLINFGFVFIALKSC